MDLDLKFVPDAEAFGVLAELKERLRINIELASPDQFLPPLRGWEDRSPSIDRIGRVEFRHFDFCCQALSKLERGFERDLADVRAMVRRRLVVPDDLVRAAREIVPDLVRYPAVDPSSFLRAVDDFAREASRGR